MRNWIKLLLVLICLSFAVDTASAQNKQVRDGLRKIAQGKSDEAQTILEELLNKYPVDPGIVYLQASLTPDASKAILLYRKILNEFAKSEWTDDAYWRLVQYYAVKGDTASAVKALEQFKTFQPTSEYIAAASDVVYVSLMYNRELDSDAPKATPKEAKPIIKKDEASAQASPAKEIKTKEPQLIASKNEPKKEVKKEVKEEKVKYWGLQAGVYSTIEAAKDVCAKFQEKRLKNQIVEKDVDGKKMFAVIIGKYKTKETAEAEKETVGKICKCEILLYGYK